MRFPRYPWSKAAGGKLVYTRRLQVLRQGYGSYFAICRPGYCEYSLPDARNMEAQRGIQQLTGQERQLLPLVCSGLRNKEIATRLGIAETTVWHHLTAIFTKLQVEDRLGLAAFVYLHGLVAPHAPDRLPPGGKMDQARLWKYPPQGLSVDGPSEAGHQR